MVKTLFYIGVFCILGSLLWPWLSKVGFGHLPGDIHIKRDGMIFHIPIVSCIIASVALSGVMYLINKLNH